MKSYNHLWEQFISEENYYRAIYNATRNKHGKKQKIAKYMREHADELKDYYLDYANNFKNARHTPMTIYDGVRRKKRQIYVPTMDEQVIHHMVSNVLQPIFMKPMYEHSYGSIPNRGAHKAMKKIKSWIKKDPDGFKYILKLDIKKYFDSIPHDVLKAKLARLIHDDKFLSLLYTIVDVTDVGIPIGFYTSQWIANWYLTELDHYIKEVLKAKYYVRYMDDMVITGGNKEELHKIKHEVEAYLNNMLGLELKSSWQVFPLASRDLDFMGFRFSVNKITLRKSILAKAVRKSRRVHKNGVTILSARQMLSYNGWLGSTNVYDYYLKYIKPNISFRELKWYVGYWQRKQNNIYADTGDTAVEYFKIV